MNLLTFRPEKNFNVNILNNKKNFENYLQVTFFTTIIYQVMNLLNFQKIITQVIFVVRKKFPIIFFNCKKKLKDFCFGISIRKTNKLSNMIFLLNGEEYLNIGQRKSKITLKVGLFFF